MSENQPNPPVRHTDLTQEEGMPSPAAVHFVFIAAPRAEDSTSSEQDTAAEGVSAQGSKPTVLNVITAHTINVGVSAAAGLIAFAVMPEALFGVGVAGAVFSGGMVLIRKVLGK